MEYFRRRLSMPANYRQLLGVFNSKPKNIRDYFVAFPDLVEDCEWEVPVSYVFLKIERVKHMTLYVGIRRLHRADAEMTWDLLNKDHMSRGRFRELFEIVFGKAIEKPILDKLSAGEKMRDRVVHGKNISAAEMRTGLKDAFDFCETFDGFVYRTAGFRPFGELRGFVGRGKPLSKETTRWVLQGMGIPAKLPTQTR
jgi:hypothetical protein